MAAGTGNVQLVGGLVVGDTGVANGKRLVLAAHPSARLCPVGTLMGRVHGSTIDLDAMPSAPFEGKRVRVVLELVDDDVRLAAAEQGLAWNAWVTHGPDGPIEDDGEPEFP